MRERKRRLLVTEKLDDVNEKLKTLNMRLVSIAVRFRKVKEPLALQLFDEISEVMLGMAMVALSLLDIVKGEK